MTNIQHMICTERHKLHNFSQCVTTGFCPGTSHVYYLQYFYDIYCDINVKLPSLIGLDVTFRFLCNSCNPNCLNFLNVKQGIRMSHCPSPKFQMEMKRIHLEILGFQLFRNYVFFLFNSKVIDSLFRLTCSHLPQILLYSNLTTK